MLVISYRDEVQDAELDSLDTHMHRSSFPNAKARAMGGVSEETVDARILVG
jgi:hypothetical protein